MAVACTRGRTCPPTCGHSTGLSYTSASSADPLDGVREALRGLGWFSQEGAVLLVLRWCYQACERGRLDVPEHSLGEAVRQGQGEPHLQEDLPDPGVHLGRACTWPCLGGALWAEKCRAWMGCFSRPSSRLPLADAGAGGAALNHPVRLQGRFTWASCFRFLSSPLSSHPASHILPSTDWRGPHAVHHSGHLEPSGCTFIHVGPFVEQGLAGPRSGQSHMLTQARPSRGRCTTTGPNGCSPWQSHAGGKPPPFA